MLVATILAIIFTVGAALLFIIAHPHDNKGKYIGMCFAVVVVFTYVLFPCWASVVALIELIIAYFANRTNLKVFRLS